MVIAVNTNSSGGAALRSNILPVAASLNAQRSRRGALGVGLRISAVAGIVVQAQLGKVAVHVVNSPVVDQVLAGRYKVVAFAVGRVVGVSSHFRHVRAHGRLGQILPAVQSGGGFRSAGVFPLRFGGQIEDQACLVAQNTYERIRIDIVVGRPVLALICASDHVVRDLVHRVIQSNNSVGRIISGYAFVLSLGHFKNADVIGLRQSDLVLQFAGSGGVASDFTAGAAHSEGAGLNEAEDQLGGLVFITPAAFGNAGQIAHGIACGASAAGKVDHHVGLGGRMDGNAEAEVVITCISRGVLSVAFGGTTILRKLMIAAAFQNAGRSCRGALGISNAGAVKAGVPVKAPLPNIAVHIVKAPGVPGLGSAFVRQIAICVEIPGQFAQFLVFFNVCYVFPVVPSGGRLGSAGEFPLRFGRQVEEEVVGEFISDGKEEVGLGKIGHVETVVLLSKGEVDSKKIRVEFSLEDMDMSEFQDGATYTQIKDYVLEHSGLKVSNLYISQIKRKCGIEVGKNYNLPKSEDSRQPLCPPEKEKAIREAFKYFGII